MYELIQVGENTYYIDCPVKIGIYQISPTEVCLIDSGNDKDAGRKIVRIIENKGWKISCIINTHSHADHIGGNQYIQNRLGCPVYSVGIDTAFVNHPILEPTSLYGGTPCKELRHKFLMAKPSKAEELTEDTLPEGLEIIRLDGHSYSMIGIKTSDNIWFLGDAFTNENIIYKYHISYLYNVKEYLNSLDKAEQLSGKLFIPSHAEASDNIKELIEINRKKVYEIIDMLLDICKEKIIFENLLKVVFDYYELEMNWGQYVLVGSTIRSYLSYLYDENKLKTEFINNKMYWFQ